MAVPIQAEEAKHAQLFTAVTAPAEGPTVAQSRSVNTATPEPANPSVRVAAPDLHRTRKDLGGVSDRVGARRTSAVAH